MKKRISQDFRRYIAWKGSGKIVRPFLGAEIIEVREWIESNWQEGMAWGNYGQNWVVDHIVPLRMFDLENPEDMKICWHYKNLMPLFKQDNMNKEGNVFFAFELLYDLRYKDFYFRQLFEKIRPEVEWMIKYMDTYHARYCVRGGVLQIPSRKRKAS